MKTLLFAALASSLAGGAMAAPDHIRFGPPAPLGLTLSEACTRLDAKTVAPDGVRLFKRLDQLPWGVLEHAVWRIVSGCPVREILYQGQTYYVTSASPQLERLDPVVHGTRRQ